MASNSKEAANAQFKKAQRTQEGAQARAQYETDARAVREKTTRLRSLRGQRGGRDGDRGEAHYQTGQALALISLIKDSWPFAKTASQISITESHPRTSRWSFSAKIIAEPMSSRSHVAGRMELGSECPTII